MYIPFQMFIIVEVVVTWVQGRKHHSQNNKQESQDEANRDVKRPNGWFW